LNASKDKLSVLESYEDFLEQKEVSEIITNNPIISRENSYDKKPPKTPS